VILDLLISPSRRLGTVTT